jgi:UDP-N-acetylmuramoyl-L-alanyl-D-glutamate--2,6-diaminopimelate ligase
MKNLREILSACQPVSYVGNPDIEILSVSFDSRTAGKGELFVALRGSRMDGHEFIPLAVKNGVAAVVCESMPEEFNDNVCYILVKDSHWSLGLLASAFYGYPSHHISLLGVTGTNGKTTVATLLYRLFRSLGYKAGLFSTIEVIIEGHTRPASHTTPDPVQINQTLAEMVATGCEYAFMEVSSHAAEQKRIAGLKFAGGIYTNLTHDHLDYHPSFHDYLLAKKSFFDALPPEAFALINADDKNGGIMVQNTKARILSYGIKSVSDFHARVIETHIEGNHLQIGNREMWTQLPGVFNAYNILAVYGAAVSLGISEELVMKALSQQSSVPGRFEIVSSERGITGIVDYAHTPDALENVLKTIKEINTGERNVITIVGAGGNRDKTKRPVMAGIAARNSNKLVITSDNPRDEDPASIIKDMLQGLDPVLLKKTITITDREEAIRTVCAFAQKGDIILLAGKGHETYQEVRGVKSHFDDREMLAKYL